MRRFDPRRKNNVSVGGADAGRALVFIHGFGTDQSSWSPIVQRFAPRWRTVLLDNVGAGGSMPEAFVPHEYATLDAYATDVMDVCEVLELREAVLVGHSFGALIAVLTAIARPQLVSRLVLIGMSPHYADEPGYHGGLAREDISQVYEAVARNYPEWTQGFAPRVMGNPDRPELAEQLARSLREIPPGVVLTALRAILHSDYRGVLERVTQPTLVVQSRDDVFVPDEVAEFVCRQIPRSTLARIDAEGHFPHLSAPDAVADAIEAFIA